VSDLSGLGVLVTGAHRGVGAAVAIAVAAAGASVICVDRRLCGETVATIRAAGGRAEIWQCDVADEDSVRALFDALADARFRLDMVVHCARIAGDAPALDTATADFDRLMAVNLRGTFLVGRAAMGMMRGAGGRIGPGRTRSAPTSRSTRCARAAAARRRRRALCCCSPVRKARC